MKLDMVTQVYAVLDHGSFVHIIQPDVLVVSLSWSQCNAGFVQCKPYCIHRGCCTCHFQAKVILDGPKETGNLPRQELTVLMLCLNSTLLMQLTVGPTRGKKAINVSCSVGMFSL